MSFPPQSIKAAQLAGAARRAPSTIRKLVWEGLQLGKRESPGHPRYTLADVARLLLIGELELAGVQSNYRIGMVNAISGAIDEAVEAISSEIEAKGQHVIEGGPWAILGGTAASRIKFYVTSRPEEIAESAEGPDGILLVVCLRPTIQKAYHNLGRVLAGELPEVSE